MSMLAVTSWAVIGCSIGKGRTNRLSESLLLPLCCSFAGRHADLVTQ